MTRPSLVLILAGSLAAGVAAAPGAARAQEPGAAAPDGAKLYGEGRKLIEQGKYDEALQVLEASMQALPSPNTELLVGHAQRQSGKRAAAMETYQRVITSAGARVREGEARFQATLEEAGRWIAVLRAELGEIVVLVRGAPAGAVITIGGVEAAASSDAGVLGARAFREPGELVVAARAPDGRQVERQISVAAGGTAHVDLGMPAPSVAPAVPEAPPAPEAPAREAAGGPGMPPLPSLVAGGVGVVGLGVFAIFGAMSASAASDLDACSPRCADALRSDADAGRRDQTIANIGLVVGAAGIAAGAVLWIALPRTEAAVSLGPGRFGVRGVF